MRVMRRCQCRVRLRQELQVWNTTLIVAKWVFEHIFPFPVRALGLWVVLCRTECLVELGVVCLLTHTLVFPIHLVVVKCLIQQYGLVNLPLCV